MKKFVSVLLAAVLVLSSLSIGVFAQSEAAPLRFDENGEFKILVFSDCQDGYPAEKAMIAFINESLDEVKPDLVVFNGDNVVSSDMRSYDEILNPVVSRNIPFTFVFGNHDEESSGGKTKEELLGVYQSYDGCLAYDAKPSLHGCATHNLPILASDSENVAFNLWMFDSGAYANYANGGSGYDCVRRDQVEWYIDTSNALAAANGGKKVASLAFQHIITEEACAAIYPEFNAEISDVTLNFCDGTSYLAIPDASKFDGVVTETCCPSMDNEGQWEAFVSQGDVLGCVTGHDHVNDFIVSVDGVDAIQTPGATYHSYGKLMNRGARLITLNEDDLWSYETEMVYIYELALRDGSTIPGLSGVSRTSYVFGKIAHMIAYGFSDFMSLFSFLNA